MDIHKLEAMLKAAPRGTYKGIVPVDFAGYPLDMEAFKKLADEYALWILEDACHAPGGYFWIKKETNNTAAMAILPTSPCSPSTL